MYVPIVPAPGAFVTGQRGRFVPNFPTGRKLSFFWTGAPVCPKEVPQRSICIITACPVFVRENQKFPIKIFHTKWAVPLEGSHTPKKRAKTPQNGRFCQDVTTRCLWQRAIPATVMSTRRTSQKLWSPSPGRPALGRPIPLPSPATGQMATKRCSTRDARAHSQNAWKGIETGYWTSRLPPATMGTRNFQRGVLP